MKGSNSPQYCKQYGLTGYRRSWGRECIDLHDEQDEVITMPIGWTEAVGPDPFVVVSAA